MLNFQMYQQIRMVIGEGSIGQLGELIEHMGSKKPFIVTDKSIVSMGILDQALEGLKARNIPYAVFDEVLPNAPTDAIEKASALCKKEKCDAVVGLGGGSTMDSAKAVNVLRFNDGQILDYVERMDDIKLSPNCILIPTTSGTGSELSQGMILMGPDHTKYTLLSHNANADYAILDPAMLTRLPTQLTAATGLDALTHAVEDYTSTLASEFTDIICEKNIENIAKYLPICISDPGNIKARSRMAITASLAGWMLGHAVANAGHSIGQTIGGAFDIPHGHCVAYAEPWVLEFNAPALPEKTKYIGEALGAKFTGNETPEEIGAKTRDAFVDFTYNKCQLKPAKSFGCDESKFDELAQIIEDDIFQNFQPRKMTKADALEILKKIYK